MLPKTAAIIPAGGAGLRMGLDTPKQFCDLAGIPLLVHTVQAFQQVKAISSVVLVVPKSHIRMTEEMVSRYRLDRVQEIIAGGKERQDSVRNGLNILSDDIEIVLVHDGARPLISPALIERCIDGVMQHGAVVAGIPVKDTLKKVSEDQTVIDTVDRSELWQAQTPQAAWVKLLKKAFLAADQDNFIGTDETSLLERINCPVHVVHGSATNLKITHPDDLFIAEALLMKNKQTDHLAMRAGHGYDAHRLVLDRPLVLGGVTIPHSMGLLGHSDADVLIHALCDAILGAIGEGDIGRHFPDSDQKYKGISSITLLKDVITLADKKGYSLGNADITVVAQQPKLAPYVNEMRKNLALACQVAEDAMNIKASTTERMGFPGREEGIAAHAVVLMSAS